MDEERALFLPLEPSPEVKQLLGIPAERTNAAIEKLQKGS